VTQGDARDHSARRAFVGSPPPCPRCGTAAGVQAVAGIVAADLPTVPTPGHVPLAWQGTTYYLPLGSNLAPATRLAVRLFPPARLRRPAEPELEPLPGVPPAVLIGGTLLILLIGVVGYLMAGPVWVAFLILVILAGARAASRSMVVGNYRDSRRRGGIGMATTAIQQDARVAAALEVYDSTKPRHRAAMRKAEAKQARAVARWSTAYYCPRDDVVFVPGAPSTAPPEQMEALLYG